MKVRRPVAGGGAGGLMEITSNPSSTSSGPQDQAIVAQAQPLSAHPLADVFPLLEGAAFDELLADIRAHGVREPIWLYEEKILDGRNRYCAAEVAGLSCPTRAYEGDDPVGFVVSLNLRRRHLSDSQRAMVAARLASMRAGDNQHSEGLPIGRSSALLNVSERSVARAREVLDQGTPEACPRRRARRGVGCSGGKRGHAPRAGAGRDRRARRAGNFAQGTGASCRSDRKAPRRAHC